MKPYYQENGITIFHGDCREILPSLQTGAIITDPIWPNNSIPEFAGDSPQQLLSQALAVAVCERIVIQMGCDSDPRFLAAVPEQYPFIRVCWLEYACPSYKGRVLYTGDAGYAFGVPPKSRKGAHVIPGRKVSSTPDKLFARKTKRDKDRPQEHLAHPTPRRLQHVRWLCKWFGGESVCDPFLGSGTTALACKELGIPCIGIEREETHCELAVNRLRQQVFSFDGTEVA